MKIHLPALFYVKGYGAQATFALKVEESLGILFR